MGVALPELPDDRRAQPRRYGPANESAPFRPVAPGQPSSPPLRYEALGPPRNGHAGPPLVGGGPRNGQVPPPRGGRPGPPPERRPEPPRRPPPPPGPAGAGPTTSSAPSADSAPSPGRHRRRAGESPTGRPVAAYQQAVAGSGEKENNARPPRTGRRRRPTFWKELPLLIVVALLLTFLIQTFLAKVYVIPSGSMETTLHGCTGCNNDRVLVDKVSYRFTNPQPGDVVVFRGPDSWRSEVAVDQPGSPVVRGLQQFGSLIGLAPPDEKDFVKRVIAVGGQTVSCCDSRNRVMVDGEPLDEPYIYYLPEAGPARQIPFGPIQVPDGDLWMMGDSRNNSSDSRVPGHGPVPVANVIGKARLIVLPFDRFGWIPSTDPHTTAVGMPAGGDPATSGAPLALGMLGTLPLAAGRRWRARLEDDVTGFLPSRSVPSRRFARGRGRR